MRRVVAEGAQLSADLSKRQQEAGNVSDLAFAMERSAYEQIRLDLARSEADVRIAREHLTSLIGLWGPEIEWKISSKLAEPPEREVSLEGLESLAIAQRLDLA